MERDEIFAGYRITNKAEADAAIAAIAGWLDTNPDIDAEEVIRGWAHELLYERVETMGGCPLCQS